VYRCTDGITFKCPNVVTHHTAVAWSYGHTDSVTDGTAISGPDRCAVDVAHHTAVAWSYGHTDSVTDGTAISGPDRCAVDVAHHTAVAWSYGHTDSVTDGTAISGPDQCAVDVAHHTAITGPNSGPVSCTYWPTIAPSECKSHFTSKCCTVFGSDAASNTDTNSLADSTANANAIWTSNICAKRKSYSSANVASDDATHTVTDINPYCLSNPDTISAADSGAYGVSNCSTYCSTECVTNRVAHGGPDRCAHSTAHTGPNRGGRKMHHLRQCGCNCSWRCV